MGSSIVGRGQRRVAFPKQGEVSKFVKTHCHKCIYGWIRTNPKGDQLTVCLLDREPVYLNLQDCSRFELPEDYEEAREEIEGEGVAKVDEAAPAEEALAEAPDKDQPN